MSRKISEALRQAIRLHSPDDFQLQNLVDGLCESYDERIREFHPVTACINFGETEGDISIYADDSSFAVGLDGNCGHGNLYYRHEPIEKVDLNESRSVADAKK